MKAKIALFTMLLVMTSVQVLVANQNYLTLKQPNGVTFQAREAGYCCYIHWYETPDGYMVIRGPDRYYHYAQPSQEHAFGASGLRVGIDAPINVIKGLENYPEVVAKIKAEVERYNAAVEQNRQLFLKLQGKPDYLASYGTIGLSKTTTTTNLNIDVLLVEFNDLQHHSSPAYQKSQFENMFFSENTYYSSATPPAYTPDNENVYGSMRDYFQIQSSGDLVITGNVINPIVGGSLSWLNLGNSSSYPGSCAPTSLVVDAINRAIDNGWTVSGRVTLIIIAGSNEDLYDTGVGYPKSYFSQSQFRPSFNWTNWLGSPVFHERCSGWASGGVSFTHIGIWCHELGHVIGSGLLGGLMWEPLVTASDWSAMRVGYRTGPLRKGDCPANFDPPAIISYSWASPTLITANMSGETVSYINNKTQPKDFYRFNDPGSSSMFIIENRQYADLNSYLPDWWQTSGLGGIVFWEWYSSSSNYRTIKPGDNDFDDAPPGGDPYWCDGDGGDPFPGLSDKRIITMGTAPNTSNYNGDPTGFAITNISTSGVNMTVNFVKCLLNSSTAEATSFNNGRRIIRDSGGAYHLVFESDGQIYYQKSTDGGASWSAFKRLNLPTATTDNKYPSITGTSAKQFVVWQRYTGYSGGQYKYDIYLAKNTGSGWSTTKIDNLSNLGFSTQADPLPVVTYKNPSAPQRLLVCAKTSSGIKYVTSDTDGSSWSSANSLPYPSSSHKNPSLSMGPTTPSSTVYATYDDGSAITLNPYTTLWELGENVSVGSGTSNNQSASVEVDGSAGKIVAWQAKKNSNNKQVICYKRNTGTNWNFLPTFFEPGANNKYHRPSITGHTMTKCAIVYYDDYGVIYRSYFNGSSWSTLATSDTYLQHSNLSAGTTTAKYVFTGGSASPYNIHLSSETLPLGGLAKSTIITTEQKEQLRTLPCIQHYHRAAMVADTTSPSLLWVQWGDIRIRTKNATEVPMSFVALPGSMPQLTAETAFNYLATASFILPADTDSLEWVQELYGCKLEQLVTRGTSNLVVETQLVAAKTGVPLAVLHLATLPVSLAENRLAGTVMSDISAYQGLEVMLKVNVIAIAQNIPNITSDVGEVFIIENPFLTISQPKAQPPVAAETSLPVAYQLEQNYPNPFNAETEIRYQLPEIRHVTLEIYNLLGQQVRTLVDQEKTASYYIVHWDGKDAQGQNLASGIYVYRLEAGSFVASKKLVLIR